MTIFIPVCVRRPIDAAVDSGSGDTMVIVALDDPVMTARALVLHDLESTGVADPVAVSALEESRADLVGLYFLPDPKLADLATDLLRKKEDEA